jgi:hypothetical protein
MVDSNHLCLHEQDARSLNPCLMFVMMYILD